jgi:hypothetical protein
MPRKFSRNSLGVVVPFCCVLIALLSAVLLAQVPGAGQKLALHAVVSSQQSSGAQAHVLERDLLWRSPNGKRDFAARLGRSKRDAIPLDQNLPLFFLAATYDIPGCYPDSVAVADLNGDGHPDVVMGCDGDAVVVLLGNGDGTFQAPVSYSSGGQSAWSVAVADVNGDGHPDVVVASLGQDNGVVGVLLGNGDGTFQAPASYSSGGWTAESVAIADVNGDRHPDLVVTNLCQSSTNCNNGTVAVLLGNGDGTFQAAVSYDTVVDSDSLAVADLNGDGHPDLVVTNLCQSDPHCDDVVVDVMLGNGDGTFQPPLSYGSGGGYGFSSVATADLNGDGHPDLVVASECESETNCDNGVIGVLLGKGDGTFQPPVSYGSGGWWTESVAIADVNRDGHPDVVVASNCPSQADCVNGGAVGVLLANGDGTFQEPVNYGSGGYCTQAVAIADLNGDGRPDVIAASECNNDLNVGVLLHVGNIPTTTVETSSPNPSTFGQAVTLTATVNSSSGTPTGMVVFYDGSTALGNAILANGIGAISVSSLAAGSHAITAVYQGSVKFNSSASTPLTQVVTIASTTTLFGSLRNPVALNKPVTYQAMVFGQYGGAVTGSVTFEDGGVAVATVPLKYYINYTAEYTTSYKTRGTHVMTATYSGDSNNASSVSPPVVERVKGFASKTVVTTSGSPSHLGQSVTLTAKVASPKGIIPDGELVTFYDGKKVLGSVPLANGQAAYTTSTLVAGKHVIKAVYPGDNTFEPSSGTVQQVVQK